jgi:hypothetical protein
MPVVYVTDELLDETARLLASFADGEESEGVTYWFGLEFGARAVVTTLVIPDADTSNGTVRTSAKANAEAVSVAIGTPLVLLGQAHSHPFQRVSHSWVDDRDTFAQFPGALSVVVPFYGRLGIDLRTCGVHRHIGGGFRRIRAKDVEQHLRVLPSVADLRSAHAPAMKGTLDE